VPLVHRRWSAPGSRTLLIAATDPARTPELHPLVTAVRVLHADDRTQDFELDERVPLGPLRVPNRYRARRVLDGDRLVLEAWSRPGVHLVHTLHVVARDGHVDVDHAVAIEAPWWVRGFVVRTARAAHDAWIGRVQAWMAAHAAPRGATSP
jgi:hypothetical protein